LNFITLWQTKVNVEQIENHSAIEFWHATAVRKIKWPHRITIILAGWIGAIVSNRLRADCVFKILPPGTITIGLLAGAACCAADGLFVGMAKS
jgi:hypothetical protein